MGENEDFVQIQLELMTALSRSSGLQETLKHCYEAALRVSGLDSGGIYLVEPDGTLCLAMHHGLGEAFLRANSVVPPEDPRAQLVREGRSFYTNLRHLRARIGRDDEEEASEGLEALAVVPILLDGRAVGSMNLASHTLESVPERGQRLLEVVAGQIAQTIAKEVATAQLREREENLQAFFESVDDYLFVLDESARILHVNPAVTRVFGGAESELVGVPMNQLHTEERPEVHAGAVTYEVVLQGPNDVQVPVEIHMTKSTWNGAPAFFCVARDLTAQQAAQARLLSLERQVLQSQKLESLGVMAGGIAHDFNNILMSVLGTASVALEEVGSGSAVRPMLHDIVAGAQRAAALCRQMLAYSGRGRFEIESIDLSAHVEQLSPFIRTCSDRHDHVEFRLADGLAAIQADATQVDQVIMNLVLNAVEATEAGAGKVHVGTAEVNLEQAQLQDMVCAESGPGRFVMLVVSDEGVGMAPETVDRLFDPFFTTKETGRGLGMSAVLGIVRGHRGALSVQTAVGMGSTFRVYFPVTAEPVRARPTQAPSVAESNARVLLVDDDPMVLKVVARLLTHGGLKVRAVTSSQAAIAALSEAPSSFDLVLLDLTMPAVDGGTAFEALRSVDDTIPIVIMSGYAKQELTLRLSSGTPAGFLGKPFTRDELLNVVWSTARPPRQLS